MTCFALYRLPYEHQVTLVGQSDGQPACLQFYDSLGNERGFVIAPFQMRKGCEALSLQTLSACPSVLPMVLIRPDIVETFSEPQQATEFLSSHFSVPNGYTSGGAALSSNDARSSYSRDFSRFHSMLKEGRFSKIVLSRCTTVPITCYSSSITHALDLFTKTCNSYPRVFVSLAFSPQSGMWLTATPEVLLESTAQNCWHTVALAGTMRLSEIGPEPWDVDGRVSSLWSEKNIEEQRYVASYIAGCLSRFSHDVKEDGPHTIRAAHLVHLRSDFTFSLSDSSMVGPLLGDLHPTPAVCGIPKDETCRFIMENESSPRLYYSGFMGPLQSPGTHLYVSLRCMQITTEGYRLYAGGGLLKESTEEQEWQETEAKMETMLTLL